MKPIEFSVHVRNNRLKKLRHEKGLSQMMLTEFAGVSIADVQVLETLRPIKLSKKLHVAEKQIERWAKVKQRICDALESTVDFVFPAELEQIKKNRWVKEIDVPEHIAIDRVKDRILLPEAEMLKEAEAAIIHDSVEEVIKTLPNEREAQIIRLRFGIGTGYPRTLEEIGHIYGISRDRVRQIEAKAIRKLRHPSRSRPLRECLPG